MISFFHISPLSVTERFAETKKQARKESSSKFKSMCPLTMSLLRVIGRAGPEPAVNIISDHIVLEVPHVDSCFPGHSRRPSADKRLVTLNLI